MKARSAADLQCVCVLVCDASCTRIRFCLKTCLSLSPFGPSVHTEMALVKANWFLQSGYIWKTQFPHCKLWKWWRMFSQVKNIVPTDIYSYTRIVVSAIDSTAQHDSYLLSFAVLCGKTWSRFWAWPHQWVMRYYANKMINSVRPLLNLLSWFSYVLLS